jgi:hypothetical protein
MNITVEFARSELLLLQVVLTGAQHHATKQAAVELRKGNVASAERHRVWARECAKVAARLEEAEARS